MAANPISDQTSPSSARGILHTVPLQCTEGHGYHDDHRSQGNPSPCYSGTSPCGGGMGDPSLLHSHLPPALLLDDSEDSGTSSASHAISATTAANSSGNGGDDWGDISWVLAGGLDFGPLGSPSSTSGIDESFRGGEDQGNMNSNPQNASIKPKRTRKPRAKKDPNDPGQPPKLKQYTCRSQCSVCGKEFARHRDLRRHDRVHSGEKSHQCSVCGKYFREPHHLKMHLIVHTGAKDYKCTICGKYFRDTYNLKMHQKIHTGAKDYKCAICGKYFREPNHLKSHQKIHTGAKDYKCTICGKYFRESYNLKIHLTVHTGAKDYKCTICGKAFGHTQSLKKHYKLHQKGKMEEVPTTPAGGNGNSFNPNTQCSGSQDGCRNEANTSSSYRSHARDVNPQGSDSTRDASLRCGTRVCLKD